MESFKRISFTWELRNILTKLEMSRIMKEGEYAFWHYPDRGETALLFHDEYSVLPQSEESFNMIDEGYEIEDTINGHNLESRLINQLADRLELMSMDRMTAIGYLSEFCTTHGRNGLRDLLAFLIFADETGRFEQNQINFTINHDLAGRNDNLMLPRTNGYNEKLYELKTGEKEVNPL